MIAEFDKRLNSIWTSKEEFNKYLKEIGCVKNAFLAHQNDNIKILITETKKLNSK